MRGYEGSSQTDLAECRDGVDGRDTLSEEGVSCKLGQLSGPTRKEGIDKGT